MNKLFSFHISKDANFKIGLILLFIAISFTTIVTYGNYDAFFPRNIASLTDLIYFGDGGSATIIGYQTYASIFCLILGISPEYLLIIPIFLVPLFLFSFLLILRLSGSPIISSFLVISVFSLNTSSTTFIFWIHSHGLVLMFLLIFLFVLYFSKFRLSLVEKTSFFICSIIILIATNYSSYNYMAQLSLLIGITAVLLIIISGRNLIFNIKSNCSYPTLAFIGLTGFSAILVFILNMYYKNFLNFLYYMFTADVSPLMRVMISFLPFLDNNSQSDFLSATTSIPEVVPSIINDSTHSIIGETVSIFTNEILPASVLLPYYVSTGSSNPTIPGILRYLVIVVAICAYCLWIFKSFVNKEDIRPLDIFLTSFLIMTCVYIVIRFFVGQLPYSLILYPGIFIFARFIGLKDSKYIWNTLGFIFIISSIILMCLFVAPSLVDNDGIKAVNALPQTKEMGEWSYTYSINSISTDVYSEGTMRLTLSLNHIMRAYNANIFSVFEDLGRVEILSLVRSNMMMGGNRDLVINYLLPQISAAISDWVTLFPWYLYEDKIRWNSWYNIVCTFGGVDYMHPVLSE